MKVHANSRRPTVYQPLVYKRHGAFVTRLLDYQLALLVEMGEKRENRAYLCRGRVEPPAAGVVSLLAQAWTLSASSPAGV